MGSPSCCAAQGSTIEPLVRRGGVDRVCRLASCGDHPGRGQNEIPYHQNRRVRGAYGRRRHGALKLPKVGMAGQTSAIRSRAVSTLTRVPPVSAASRKPTRTGASISASATPWTMASALEGELAHRFNELEAEGGNDQGGDVHAWSAMFNLYYDFGRGDSYEPYIGVGVGAARLNANAHDSGGRQLRRLRHRACLASLGRHQLRADRTARPRRRLPLFPSQRSRVRRSAGAERAVRRATTTSKR